jgi:multimeric flavodoxin WrbA
MQGSPRRQGNGALLAERLAAGARDVGARVESFFVHGMEIRPCDGCDGCKETGGQCVVEDDMQILYPEIVAADAIVVVTPIYWYTLSAQTKLWIDRCYALVMDPQGDRMANKDYGIVLTYAQPDAFTSGAVNALRAFQDMFERGNIAGVVQGASAYYAGAIEKYPQVLDQAYALGQRLGAPPG